MDSIHGFSKLSKEGKIAWLGSRHIDTPTDRLEVLKKYWHQDPNEQRIFDDFSENTLSNFYLPFCVAPNFLIDDKLHTIPMVTEESSVVAAASKAAKFWLSRGGIKTNIIGTEKIGHVHFYWDGPFSELEVIFNKWKPEFLNSLENITNNMIKRGGGISNISLKDRTESDPFYYQIEVCFETCDAMGANFINTVLEKISSLFKSKIEENFSAHNLEIIMSILSNYTPQCLVETQVSCPIEEMGPQGDMDPQEFSRKFCKAVKISSIDTYRAVTHNKGIFNGIDAVVLATGNDFRAVEACGHAYAARSGSYRGLSIAKIYDGKFFFSLKLPLALGTVGGLTKLHPLAKISLELLGNPNSKDLMKIVASVGLAQNFSAIRSLVTTGIQKGHMKMHLLNILNSLKATQEERKQIKKFFHDKTVSVSRVRDYLLSVRKIH